MQKIVNRRFGPINEVKYLSIFKNLIYEDFLSILELGGIINPVRTIGKCFL